ncbi:MAG: AGE family epimerase/isomerase, partial [Chthonomonadales bacterium]
RALRSMVPGRTLLFAAQALKRYPKDSPLWTRMLKQGVDYLTGPISDSQDGAWYWEVGTSGQPDAGRKDEKHLYGISFAIYALSAASLSTNDPNVLQIALGGFEWLEKHAHDAKNGGYYEAYARNGDLILTAPSPGMTDTIGTQYGLKSMNSHIHILESLTELFHASNGNAKVRVRLEEVFHVVRDRVFQKSGYLGLYFNPDWTCVSNVDSFGHDIETAFLLVEAATALGMPNETLTWQVARQLVDHALKFGWDEEHGGFYDSGTPEGKVTKEDKVWWTQAEGLNALKLMAEKFGKTTDKYVKAYAKQWDFINRFQVDHEFGGWYTEVETDGKPRKNLSKSDAWKDPYHQGRALFHLSR